VTASVGVQAFIFDIGWGELVLIGVVALIVIGPKELPATLRTVGQYMTKIRRMAAEFQSQFQEAMREAEMADLKQHFDTIQDAAKDLRNFDPVGTVRSEIEGAASDKLSAAPPGSSTMPPAEAPAPESAAPSLSAPAGAPPAEPPAAPAGEAAPPASAGPPEAPKGQPG
jgi:sec-independent protein translocase protein TatB